MIASQATVAVFLNVALLVLVVFAILAILAILAVLAVLAAPNRLLIIAKVS
jgi:hypothetical protein